MQNDDDQSTLVIERLSGGAKATASLKGLTAFIAKLEFSPDDRYLLVVGEDREHNTRLAQLFTPDGKPHRGRLGPATDFDFGTAGSTPVLVAFDAKSKKGATTLGFTTYGLADLKVQKRKVFTQDKQGLLKGLETRVVSYAAGYLRIVGQRKGEFDAKNDIRKPENIAIIDALSGKVIEKTEITDPIAWAEVAKLRAERPTREAFLYVEELKSAVLVGRDHKKSDIKLKVPVHRYEPKSLAQRMLGTTLYVSFAVDPVNPDATAKGKTDRPDVESVCIRFSLDRGAPPAAGRYRPTGDLDGGQGPGGGAQEVQELLARRSGPRGLRSALSVVPPVIPIASPRGPALVYLGPLGTEEPGFGQLRAMRREPWGRGRLPRRGRGQRCSRAHPGLRAGPDPHAAAGPIRGPAARHGGRRVSRDRQARRGRDGRGLRRRPAGHRQAGRDQGAQRGAARATPAMVQRFVQEARAVNQIGHPNIVDVFAFGQLPDGRHYFVMELLEGESLRAADRAGGGCTSPRRCALPAPDLRRARRGARAKASSTATSSPTTSIVAKPKRRRVVVKLLDFGIAKLFAPPARGAACRPRTGMPIGTPDYMSPEQARGDRPSTTAPTSTRSA